MRAGILHALVVYMNNKESTTIKALVAMAATPWFITAAMLIGAY